MKNSLLIERLQANLALSPTSLLPTAKPPEVKQQPVPLSPISLSTTSLHTPSQSPTQSPTLLPPQHSSEEEEPASFERPAEGTPLPCFNKGRARLSFKRRPPTRQHRRSRGSGDEGGASGSSLSPCELHSPQENGGEEVFESPGQEAQRGGGNSPPRQSTLDESDEEMGGDSAETDGRAPTQNAATASEGWEEFGNKSPPEGEDSGEQSEAEAQAPEYMEAVGEDGQPSGSYSPEMDSSP
ncbi:capZ-interacting protein [Aplochiton taeniatus]